MANTIEFKKEAVATSYLADQFYIFEANITPGAQYDDVGKLVMEGAKRAGENYSNYQKGEPCERPLVKYIGSIQKPALDWSGKLNRLWLIFKNSSNTDAVNYAIVMDMGDDFRIPAEDNIFTTLIGGPFSITLKRLIYSHNLEPNLKGSSGKAIFGKDTSRNPVEPVIDWPHGMKAGFIYMLSIGLGELSVDFPYIDALPSAKKYVAGGVAVNSDVKTGLDVLASDYDSKIKELKRKDAKARKDGNNEGKLTDKEKEKLEKLKKYKKDTKAVKDLILQPNWMYNDSGIKNIIVVNKGQGLSIKFSIVLKVGPVFTGQVLGFNFTFSPTKNTILDWGIGGIAFDVKNPPSFALSGAVLFNPKEFPSFKSIAGGLSLSLTRYSILILAAYDEVTVEDKIKKEKETFTSLFVFGFVGGDFVNILGIVTINGLALTAGVNRSMLMPTDMSELPNHPIVKAASSVYNHSDDRSKPDDKDDMPAKQNKPGQDDDPNAGVGEGLVGMVASIKKYVPPKPGSFFVGAGVRADIVQLIDLFLMPVVTIELDPEDMPMIAGLKIQLFGMAALKIPKDMPEDLAPLVLRIALGAEIALTNKGDVSVLVGGSLFNSVLRVIPDVELNLEGGFAFWLEKKWKESPSFVATAGGYGTILTPEPGWPIVDPIAIRFNPIDNIEIGAEHYFFICNQCMGIGFDISGRANIEFSRVSAKASFSIGLNALMQFDPFYIEIEAHANFHLDVSVDYFLSSEHKELDLQAQLVAKYGQGVPFSGWAEIELNILFTFTIDVEWGEEAEAPDPIYWEDYLKSFVKRTTEDGKIALGTARLTGGVERKKDDYYIVEPNTLELEAEAYFPCASIQLNEETEASASEEAHSALGIQMMGVTYQDYKETMNPTLEVKLMDGEGKLLDATQRQNFSIEVLTEDVPAALWLPSKDSGSVPKPDPHGPDTVKDSLKGIRLKANAPIAGVGHPIPKDNLAFDLTFADDVEMYTNEAIAIGKKVSEKAVTDSMVAHQPDAALLAAMGLSADDVAFSHLTDIDLQAIPYLD
ncbi:MAG: DUF6603 domain-containing protein [Bacteroidota bacterium]